MHITRFVINTVHHLRRRCLCYFIYAIFAINLGYVSWRLTVNKISRKFHQNCFIKTLPDCRTLNILGSKCNCNQKVKR